MGGCLLEGGAAEGLVAGLAPPLGRRLVETGLGLVSRASPVQTAVRNCTRDEGGPFETGSQVQVSSHRKLLWSKVTVVSVAETPGR